MGRHRVKPRKVKIHRNSAEFECSPHENLALAIVAQTINDARAMMDGRKVYASEGGGSVSEWELLNFFQSKWCDVLLGTTDLTGEDIAERIGFYDFIGR